MILRTKNRLADPDDTGLTGTVFGLLSDIWDAAHQRGWTGRIHVSNNRGGEQEPSGGESESLSDHPSPEIHSTTTDSEQDEPPLVVGPLELPDELCHSRDYYNYIKVVSS